VTRLAGILAAGGGLILISWVTAPAARTTPDSPRVSRAEIERVDQAAQAVAPLSTQIDEQAARLRARLSQPPPKPEPDRNPFRFGAGVTPGSGSRKPINTQRDGISTPPALARPASPALVLPSLVAITSDAGDGGIMRMAVLSMNDEMKTVKPGQMFDRFIVEAIGPDSVRIVDITSPARATFIVAIR
jgi:hypothetical protein